MCINILYLLGSGYWTKAFIQLRIVYFQLADLWTIYQLLTPMWYAQAFYIRVCKK